MMINVNDGRDGSVERRRGQEDRCSSDAPRVAKHGDIESVYYRWGSLSLSLSLSLFPRRGVAVVGRTAATTHDDEMRRDETRRDETRRDETRRDETRDQRGRERTREDETRRDETRRDETRRDETRRDETRRDEMRRDETRRDKSRCICTLMRSRRPASMLWMSMNSLIVSISSWKRCAITCTEMTWHVRIWSLHHCE